MDQDEKDGNTLQPEHPNRDQSGNQGRATPPERGTGNQRERNSSGGISNRGMDRELEEQEELSDRDSDQSESDQSER